MGDRIKTFILIVVELIENSKYRYFLLLLPALILVVGFMIIPLFTLFRISFHESDPTLVYIPGFTLEHYFRIISDLWYLRTFMRSVQLGVIVVFTSGILGYVVAYTIWRSGGVKRFTILLFVLFSLFTTIVIRLFGMSALLARTGPINEFLQAIHITQEPIRLTYNVFGVVAGLTNECMPFVVLIIISVLEGIRWSHVEAATDLGASKARAFFEVIFPLSARGLVIASAISFIWTIGAFATPAILGSPREWTLAMEAERQILQVYNWPLGAAVAFVLLFISLLVIVVYFRLILKERGDAAS